jgi:predicted  nucleic acid-binding Zn-ribbon protein
MPSTEREWQEFAYSNRERIRSLEHELERVRERQHEMATEIAVIRYLGEKVRDLGVDVVALTEQVERVASRSLPRPRQSTLSLFAQYGALLVALVALLVAVTR